MALTRGTQVLRGQRLVYNFVQGSGSILNARGEVFIPSGENNGAPNVAGNPAAGTPFDRPVSDRVTAAQPTRYGELVEVLPLVLVSGETWAGCPERYLTVVRSDGCALRQSGLTLPLKVGLPKIFSSPMTLFPLLN